MTAKKTATKGAPMGRQEKSMADAERYLWIREFATGRQLNELADLDAEDWDDFIDKARACR